MSELAIAANIDPLVVCDRRKNGADRARKLFSEAPLGRAMNDQGHVASTSLLAGDENCTAFLSSNNQMIDLGSLGGNATRALFCGCFTKTRIAAL